MIDFKVKGRGKGKVGVLRMDGELTMQNAGEFKEALMRSLEKTKEVVLDLEKVTKVDLSFLQLLCSAHRTSVKLKKSLMIGSNCPDIIKRSVEDAGFSRHEGCHLGKDKSCLWSKDGN